MSSLHFKPGTRAMRRAGHKVQVINIHAAKAAAERDPDGNVIKHQAIKFARSGTVYAVHGDTGQIRRVNGNKWRSKAERKAHKKALREVRAENALDAVRAAS